MNSFSIAQLGRYSGVKPHTIRTWEKRYQALQPARSDGNTRHYDASQMRRLLNIVSLSSAGYKVSELSTLPDEDLFHLLAEETANDPGSDTPEEYFITQLVAAGMTYDEPLFEKVCNHCLLRYKLRGTYERILLPMLSRVGLLWSCDEMSAAHEHFISNLVRQKLFTSVDALPPAPGDAEKWLLFLPEDEFHEIGLLMAYNLIRMAGKQAVYLGANLPLTALQAAIGEIQPDNLLCFLVHPELPKWVKQYVRDLGDNFSGKRICLAADKENLAGLRNSGKVHCLSSVEDLVHLLESK